MVETQIVLLILQHLVMFAQLLLALKAESVALLVAVLLSEFALRVKVWITTIQIIHTTIHMEIILTTRIIIHTTMDNKTAIAPTAKQAGVALCTPAAATKKR